MVEIYSNGSKWAGEKLDTLEKLLEVLNKHKLDIASFGVFGFVSDRHHRPFARSTQMAKK